MKILILDRSRFIKETLQARLEDETTEVRCTNTSDAALLCVINWHPDIIISSVEVGEINGFDLCMILKLMPDYAAIPVIIVSSGEIDALQRKAADVGADFYVPKDQHIFEHVSEAIGRACGQTRKPEETVTSQAVAADHEAGSVLVVDDSSVIRRIIRNMLNSIGIDDIIEASNGGEAFELLQEHNIGLVLTDWNMPVMNGLDLIKKTRSNPEFDSIPMVMVTTEGGDTERQQARDAGATDHLSKPFSMEKIRNMAERFSGHIHINRS